MPFPLPRDIEFRKEIIRAWLEDVDERLSLNRKDEANLSWKEANNLYLKLGCDGYDENIEEKLVTSRVKIDSFTQQLLCEQSQTTQGNQLPQTNQSQKI